MAETQQDLPSVAQVAAMIDHALLKPDITLDEVNEGLRLALHHGVFSVCVQPSYVVHAAQVLAHTGVKVGTVIAFPHGSTTTATKVFEAEEAVRHGAVEVDMVLNISWLKSGDLRAVEQEIRTVTNAAHARGAEIVKVILETAYLTEEEVRRASAACERAGADFVKTSTGFAGEGATIANLRLMRGSVSADVQVKASGGVRDLDTLLQMHAEGVTRFGTSATQVILDDLTARLSTGEASGESFAGDY
jgi:deoxyribose-phosphate aldolase